MFNFGKKKEKRKKKEKEETSKRILINDFDEQAYLDANPDVAEGIVNGQFRDALHHLETFGFGEIQKGIRRFHKDIEPYKEVKYLEDFPEVEALVQSGEFSSVFDHFCKVGYTTLLTYFKEKHTMLNSKEISMPDEEKLIKGFNQEAYLKANLDVNNLIEEGKLKNALEHLEIGGLGEIEAGYRKFHYLFDPFNNESYLELLKMIECEIDNLKFASPFEHFCAFGYNEIVNNEALKVVEKISKLDHDAVTEVEETVTIPDTLDGYDRYVYEALLTYNLDWSEYFIKNNHPFVSLDPIIDYIKNWNTYQPIIPKYFDTAFYLTAFPDIKQSGIMPLLHYVEHGNQEGRQCILNEANIVKGHLVYDPNKETIVFVTHESSASGAPLLGFNIVDKLKQKYNIVHIVIKKSNIHDSFLKNCDLMLHDIEEHTYTNSYFFMRNILKERPVKCVIINSIVAHHVTPAAKKLNLPILYLIHEFSEYMRPSGTMAKVVLESDNVIVPAQIIKESIHKEFKKFKNDDLNKVTNIHIIPQGKLPYLPETYGKNDSIQELYEKLDITSPNETKIIVASGWVQIRKGVDLFIATARYIKQLYGKNCKFVWVGGGFNPDEDLAYSVYLEREIEFSGLGNDFIFLEHQQNLDNIFSIADVFCLTSRMDPFPNVVIDALYHDLHVACFNHASGSAEFLAKYESDSTIVDFVDIYAMAKGIVQYIESGVERSGTNKQLTDRYLNFDKYVESLDNLIEHSQDSDKNMQVSE